MREERTVQASLFDLFAGHDIGRELKAMSAWLDDHRELARLVAADLRRHGVKATEQQGLPAEAVPGDLLPVGPTAGSRSSTASCSLSASEKHRRVTLEFQPL